MPIGPMIVLRPMRPQSIAGFRGPYAGQYVARR